MQMYRRKMAQIVLNGLLAGAMSALICVAQSSPASPAAGPSAAQSSSENQASAKASSPHKVVLKVGETQVTQADIDYLIGSLSPQVQSAVASRGRKPVGDEYAMMVLLSQKAQSEHLDASADFQQKIALQKLQILAEEEYRKIAEGIQVSPEDVNTYYNAHKDDFEEAQVREFVVRKKAADAKADAPGLSAVDAKARLAAIRKAVEAGTDIKQVAKQFDVPNVVMVNPEPQTVHKGEMMPALDQAAFGLKDNQFSEPVDTPQALVLLQVLTHQQKEVKAVSGQIENELKQQKLRAAIDDMKAKANIWMDPEYFKTPATASEEPEDEPGTAPEAPAHP
jgi:peptidyl-prolyl cis-trans isomerase C